MMRHRSRHCATLLLGMLVLGGCDGGPDRVEVPGMQPDTVAAAALKQCDGNGDGFIDENEAGSAPGLKAGWKRLDVNSDGKVSADELADRVRVWLDSKLGAMTYGCAIVRRGRPVEGATVTLEPEPFLATVLPRAEGTTGAGGITYPMPTTPDALGMPVGFYRVRVSHMENGRETIPKDYNETTVLGVEVAGDCEGVATPAYTLTLDK